MAVYCPSARHQPPPAQAVAEQGRPPNSAKLFPLLTPVEAMGLRDGFLMCPGRDMLVGVDLEALRRWDE